jgi:hypothetical protein
VKGCLRDLLLNDHFLDLVSSCKNADKFAILTSLAKAFLAELSGPESRQFFEQFPSLEEPFECLKQFCKCIANLFQLDIGGHAPSDVLYFVQYKGHDLFARSVKALLTAPEPDGPNHIPIRAESRSWLQSLCADVVRTAATSMVASGQFAEAKHKMDTFVQEVSQESFNSLETVLKLIPELKSKLRRGATADIERQLIQHTRAIVQILLQNEDIFVTSAQVEVCMAVLTAYKDEAGCLDQQSLLMNWATKHNVQMALTDLGLWCNDLISKCSDMRDSQVPMNIQSLKAIVLKLQRSDFDEELQTTVANCCYFILKQLFLQASNGKYKSKYSSLDLILDSDNHIIMS